MSHYIMDPFLLRPLIVIEETVGKYTIALGKAKPKATVFFQIVFSMTMCGSCPTCPTRLKAYCCFKSKIHIVYFGRSEMVNDDL